MLDYDVWIDPFDPEVIASVWNKKRTEEEIRDEKDDILLGTMEDEEYAQICLICKIKTCEDINFNCICFGMDRFSAKEL